MFQAFHQFPHRLVQRRGHTGLFSPLHDGAVHEIHFRLAPGQHILQHAGPVRAGRVSAFLHQLPGIAEKLDTQLLGHG